MKERGFTFVEVLIVLVLVAILSALAFPSVSQWLERSRVNSYANKLYSLILRAKDEAYLYGSSKVKLEGDSVHLYRDDEDRAIESLLVPSGLQVSTNCRNNEVKFYRSGLPSYNCTFTISSSSGRISYEVVINLSGRVVLERK